VCEKNGIRDSGSGIRRTRSAGGLLRFAPHASLLTVCVMAVTAASAQTGLGDPTQPTFRSEPAVEPRAAAGPRWHLQSTLLASNRRLAVINGRTVVQGGRIDGATVLEVRRDGVTLDIGGQRVDLRLWQDVGGVKRAQARAP
jgi:hypothetical protein